MKHLAVEHKINIDVPESLPLIPVDYVQMQQVFTNLVSNSLKYAPANTTVFIGTSIINEQTIRVQVSVHPYATTDMGWCPTSPAFH